MRMDQATMPQSVSTSAAWGEQPGQSERVFVRDGDWSFELGSAGIDTVTYAGTLVSPRIGFTVRDLAWGTPELPLVWSTDGAREFRAEVEGFPLVVTGSLEIEGDRLRVDFRITASGRTVLARYGPIVLHEPDTLWPSFEVGCGPDRRRVSAPTMVSVDRVVTGFDSLGLASGAVDVDITLAGGDFEMEDQRNWGDATFKSYCPPLGGPDLDLEAGETRDFLVVVSSTMRESPVERPLPKARAGDHRLPQLGLAHRGGELAVEAVALLRKLRPAYLHLLVDLADPTWREELHADLIAAAQLDADAVLSVDVARDQFGLLDQLATVSRGRASTAYVFDHGLPCTSDALADAAESAFRASGIRVGGGSRSHFANLSKEKGVPTAVADVAVAVAVASHVNERPDLVESLKSLPAIVDAARELIDGRPLLVGPVGFGMTFDSWGPEETEHELGRDWMAGHPRDGSSFAAVWAVSAIATLAECDVRRATIGATVGGRGVLALDDSGSRFVARPIYFALSEIAGLGADPVRVSRPEPGVVVLADEVRKLTASLVGARPTLTVTPLTGD